VQSDSHDLVQVQKRREFSRYNAAKEFEEGMKLLHFEPLRAEEKFRRVIELDPNNPYGYAYLLFALEDNARPLSMLLTICSKFVEVAEKKRIHGLDGLSKMMFNQYLSAHQHLLMPTT